MQRAEPSFRILQRAAEEMDDLFFRQRLKHVNTAAGEQGRNDLERRIFGGSADQADVALLYVREKRILLSFIEAVDFVDENDGARAVLAGALGVSHDLLDLLDTS